VRAILFFHAALAVAGGWQPLGPFGGPAGFVSVDAANGSRLIASSRNGNVFLSVDGARTWSRLPFPRVPGAAIEALKIHPKDPQYFLAAVAGETRDYSGLYESRDGGKTWTLAKGIDGEAVFSIAFFLKDPDRMAVGTRSGVFLSSDRGRGWRPIFRAGEPHPSPVMSLAFDPEDSQTLYGGTTHLPWRTRDGGKSWTSIHQGMIDDSDVFSIHVDSKHPEKIHASACSGIYLSDSRGDQWRRVQGIPGSDRRTHVVTEDPAYSHLLFAGTTAGLWKSADAGSTWRKLNNWVVRSVEFHPTDGRVMYLATADRGLLKSTTAGFTFDEVNDGFTGRPIEKLVKTSQGLAVVALGISGSPRLHRLSPKGWTVDDTAPPFLEAFGHRGEIYLRTGQGLVRESAGKWIPVATPSIPSVAAGGETLWIGYGKSVAWQDDGGRWRPVALPPEVGSIFEIIRGARSVIVRASSGFWLRADDETGWTKADLRQAGRIFEVTPHPEQSGTIFAATTSGLLKSEDKGKTWIRLEEGLPLGFLHAIAPHPRRRGEWWTTQLGRVYRSQDDGKTWTVMEAELESALIKRLAFGDQEDGILALTEGQGVYTLGFLP
jgi:photosystem II stability/assembly factor-like uncharacterized protein